MHNQGHIRFTLLVSWCCLLSISIVIMVVVIARGTIQKKPDESGYWAGLSGDRSVADSRKSPYSDQTSVNHVHLVLDETYNWTKSQVCYCTNTTLLLQNNSVQITAGGFYYTSAQVTFRKTKNDGGEGSMTLVASVNVKGKMPRKLSQAEHGAGTVSMSMVILLQKGDHVKLSISSAPLTPLTDDSKTYWSLFLISKPVD